MALDAVSQAFAQVKAEPTPAEAALQRLYSLAGQVGTYHVPTVCLTRVQQRLVAEEFPMYVQADPLCANERAV